MTAAKQDAQIFTEGPILPKLIRFSIPVLFALLLQATYGAVDLMVVGQFASSSNVAAVATGSSILQHLTGPLSSFAMGITVLLGQQIGQGEGRKGGFVIGAGIYHACAKLIYAVDGSFHGPEYRGRKKQTSP